MQASSRSQSVGEFDQECSDRAQAWLRVAVADWSGADILRRLFESEPASGVLAHLGEFHRFHKDVPFRSDACS
jgi:hypothetical protein